MSTPGTHISWHNDDGMEHEPVVDYHAQWRAFAVRRNFALFFLYAWPVVFAAACWISSEVLHQPLLAMTVIVLWLAVALVLVWFAGEFRCPRCRRRYGALGHRRGDVNLTRGIFDTVCSNCKLRKFEDGH